MAVLSLLAASPARAQASNRPFTWTPTLSVTQTLTDAYSPTGTPGGRHAEGITTVSPGISAISRSGRVQGTLNYSLVGVAYARDTKASNIQHRLSATGRGEIVPEYLDVNASANISRQTTSAFGVQSVDGSLTDTNQSELRSYTVQPTLRARPGGLVLLRASASVGRSQSNTVATGSGDVRSSGINLSLSPTTSGRVIGWSLQGSRQTSDYANGRKTTTDRAIASVIVRPDPELQVSVRAGVERTDLASLDQRQYENYGAGVFWSPGPRTRVQFDADRRQFGDSHDALFEHRFRRAVVRFSDSRSVSDGRQANAAGGGVTAYDLFFELFASQEPDPVARDLLVREFLLRNGVSPDTLLGGGGFLTGAVSIQRRQELSLALNGVRSSLAVSAFQTRTERGDTLSTADDDLAGGMVRQRGLSVTITHRLTPLSSLSFRANMQRSRSSAETERNALDSVSLGWTTRVGRVSNLSLTVRHAEYDSAFDPYSENAVEAAFTTRF